MSFVIVRGVLSYTCLVAFWFFDACSFSKPFCLRISLFLRIPSFMLDGVLQFLHNKHILFILRTNMLKYSALN